LAILTGILLKLGNAIRALLTAERRDTPKHPWWPRILDGEDGLRGIVRAMQPAQK
jgi:hypothetical protein